MNIVFFFLVFFLLMIVLYLKSCNELFVSEPEDTLSSVTKEEVNLIIDSLLKNINERYGKNLVRGNIYRIEKELEDNKIHYKINIFINNKDKFTNKKVLFDVSFDGKHIIVNSIKSGVSRDILAIERDAIPGRGSIILKPKVDITKVMKNMSLKNDSSPVDFKETKNKLVDRNSWILPNNKLSHNRNSFPNRKAKHEWDCFGVSKVPSGGCGVNHSSHNFRQLPNFIISNYAIEDDSDLYNWLFDPAQDSASRPVGVTGASGSS